MLVKRKIVLELNEEEYLPLKNLLGSMNDDEFKKFGVAGKDRQIMSDLWSKIPYTDDGED